MKMKNLVIVESPSKAKTINKYLGVDYQVLASYGHVRDLPSKQGSVLPQEDFKMIWESDSRSQKHIETLVLAAKGKAKIILATDPDREGEAIAWHILTILTNAGVIKNTAVERVAFNAVTKKSVLEAVSTPRSLDRPLIDSYLARRALDYLVGFTLSPVLWRKLPGARSAGRVQSLALRLTCEREKEVESFIKKEYWTIESTFEEKYKDKGKSKIERFSVRAYLYILNGKKLEKFDITNEAFAQRVVQFLQTCSFLVSSTEKKSYKRHPAAPFTTSTLQQDAYRKLGFSAKYTMMLAQKLYEGIDVGNQEAEGLITYMRTDSVHIITDAVQEARQTIGSMFGVSYVPSAPRTYKNKTKNAQEAHEAIRPTAMNRTAEQVKPFLSQDLHQLYKLIWQRALASQMESARFDRTIILFKTSLDSNKDQDDQGAKEKEAKEGEGYQQDVVLHSAVFRASGSVMTFDGFLKLYVEGSDDDEKNNQVAEQILPKLRVNQSMNISDVCPLQHFTEPSPRYTEATLVKGMEELGIGRPSTYASTLAILKERKYVFIEKGKFIPTSHGRIVTAFLEDFFAKYVEYDFTADLEEKLDHISNGKRNWLSVMNDFWKAFEANAKTVLDIRQTEVLDRLTQSMKAYLFPKDKNGQIIEQCPMCPEGKLSLKSSRFGAFVGCDKYPACNYLYSFERTSDQMENSESKTQSTIASSKSLGMSDKFKGEIFLKNGRFGPYVEVVEVVEIVAVAETAGAVDTIKSTSDEKKVIKKKKQKTKSKPKRASIPKAWRDRVDFITIEDAVRLLALPRVVGTNPKNGLPIEANSGRFGPYLSCGDDTRRLKDFDEIFLITIEQAIDKYRKEKKSRKKTS